jgi:hypothetical protein
MGSYLRRTSGQNVQTETKGHPALSFSTVGLDNNPVMERASRAISYMVSKGEKGGKQTTMKIVTKIVSEALSDASEVPPEIAEFYMKQLSAMIWWVATGQQAGDIPLPEDFRM